MQVLMMLLDARGGVVTRQQFFDQVWGGVMVGDDSLNRAIARVRRIGAEVAPGAFEIETVPRTGYRITGDLLADGEQTEQPEATPVAAGLSRRTLLAGGAAAAIGVAGLGYWWTAEREERAFLDFMAEGEDSLDYGDPSSGQPSYFRRALEIKPGNARALGLLAYSQAMRADEGQANGAGAALQEAEGAVDAALQSDPNEPHARLAQTLIQRSTLDLSANEDRLRAILSDDPRNTYAMRDLWSLLQSAGRSREAFALNERAIELKPLAATNNFPRAQLLWILGRDAEASRVIDMAMQYWPSHRWVRFARFTIFAFTGRERAALAMLDGKETAPQHYSPEAIALWRVSLTAMEERTPANVAAARSANVEAAKRDPRLASQAVMALSALGEIDAAFEVANAQLLFRSPGEESPAQQNTSPRKSTAWLFAPWLFIPPLAPLRADPRFAALCDGIGLTEYWAKRGVRPDYKIGTA